MNINHHTSLFLKVYGFLSEIIEHGVTLSFKEMGLLVNSIYCIALLYIFCDCSEKATENISKRVQDTLMLIDMKNIDQGAKKEVCLYILQLFIYYLNVICVID